MYKEDVVRICNGVVVSHKKNEIMPFAATWIDLETITQNEVSWKEKNKYCIFTYIYMESGKMILMNLCAGHEWRHRCIEWTFGHGGEKRMGQIETVALTYTCYHVLQTDN